jgi:hypothetical protein
MRIAETAPSHPMDPPGMPADEMAERLATAAPVLL